METIQKMIRELEALKLGTVYVGVIIVFNETCLSFRVS